MSLKYYNADTHLFFTESDHGTVIIGPIPGQTLLIQGVVSPLPGLTDGHIYVGNSSNIATDVSLSGDATINDTGVLTLANTSVTPSSYNYPTSLTIDSKGRITSAGTSLAQYNVIMGNFAGNAVAHPFSGDITMGDGGVVTLANSGVTASTYGSSSSIPVVTVDSKGRITSASNTPLSTLGSALSSSKIWIGVSNVATESAYTLPSSLSSSGIMYANTSTSLSTLSTLNNGILATNSSGVPFVTNYIPLGTQINITEVGTVTNGTWNGNIIPTSYGGTGVNNSSTITVSGNLVTTGANTLTLNTTGTTNITLPTSGTVLNNSLTSGYIYIGNSSNLTSAVQVSGDATMTNAGVLTLNNVTTSQTIVPTSITMNQKGLITSSSASLTSGSIITGNTSNIAAPFAVSGDMSMLYGAFTLNTTGATAGTYTNPSVSVNAKGLVTSISNGSGYNLLYNGGFQVCQRSMSSRSFSFAPAVNTYTFDRWQILTSSNQSTTVSSLAGITSGDNICRIQRNSGQTGTGAIYFGQSLTLNMTTPAIGKSVSLSFNARVGSNWNSTYLAVYLTSGTGTTDKSGIYLGFTGTTNILANTAFPTTTMSSFTFPNITVPSNVTQLAFAVSWYPVGTAGANEYLDITNVQLEVGSVCTPYGRVDYVTELNRCMYFYQLLQSVPGYGSSASYQIQAGINLSPMRTTPTVGSISPSGVSGGSLTAIDSYSIYTQSSLSYTSYMSSNGGTINFNNFSGITQGRPFQIWIGTSPYNAVSFDADLY